MQYHYVYAVDSGNAEIGGLLELLAEDASGSEGPAAAGLCDKTGCWSCWHKDKESTSTSTR